jgi:3-dehydroquinate dehydratase-1
MICVSLNVSDFSECLKMLKSLEFAEVRLDKARFSCEQIREIFSLPKSLIATCRPGFCSEEKRKQHLLEAVRSGARYVDLEIECSAAFKREIIKEARNKGCIIILSYHNYQETPSKKELSRVAGDCFKEGADIAKIACRVNYSSDIITLLSLYSNRQARQGKILAIGMGDKGKVTRIAALLLGAPFTYASFDKGSETADGQLDRKSLKRILNLMKGGGK